MNFGDWMQAIQQRTEAALQVHLPTKDIAPQRLHDAMRYSVLEGGKRVRPLLCHATGAALGATNEALDAASCAIEMIHAYSLVHDDMPCMDNDVLRRGKPTCHVEFDEATALLVGDALQTQAFRVLASALPGVSAERQIEMIRVLADASGSRGMAGGQAIDLASVGKQLSIAELEFMHLHKTGALIRASVLLGAQCANATPVQIEILTRFANRLGLLFQVVDDILDVEVDTATLGKTAGKDAADNKPTFCTILGLPQAKAMAAELRTETLSILDTLANTGAECTRLHQLTDFIVDRRY